MSNYIRKSMEAGCMREVAFMDLPPKSWQREVYEKGWRFYEPGAAKQAVETDEASAKNASAQDTQEERRYEQGEHFGFHLSEKELGGAALRADHASVASDTSTPIAA